MKKAIICNKRREDWEKLCTVVGSFSDIQVTSDFREIEDFTHFGIAFIAIEFGFENMDSIGFAKAIQSVNPACRIIFISESGYYNENLYDVNHVFLLQRPLRKESICHALEVASNNMAAPGSAVFRFNFNGTSHVIPMDSIAYFEKDLRKIIIHTCNGKTSSFYGKYEDIESRLDKRFLRCHNGIIVNMDYVVKYYSTALILNYNNTEIEMPVSRAYRNDVKTAIYNYLHS